MHSHLKTASIVAVAIIAIQAGVAAAAYCLLPDWQTRGQFGDLFGVVNASFSGLAFTGIVYSMLVQRAESSSNALAAERSAKLSAVSVLVAAYTEHARYLDSRASPDTSKVQGIHASLNGLIVKLKAELERAGVPKT